MSRPNSSLYCGDLNKEVTEANLFRIFNAVGPVSSIRVCRDAVSRQSLGYAYINFVSPVDAERALDTMNFTPINGKPCRLAWSERNPEKRKKTDSNLFIRNLHHTIDSKTLFDTFSIFGDILSCKIQTDDSGRSVGYGFVHYSTKEAAEKALEKVDGMEIAGKKVSVVSHKTRKERTSKVKDNFLNLYLKNFPLAWDEEKLGDLVKPYGECTIFILKKEDGSSKGVGFANFKDHASALKCKEELDGKQFGEGEDAKVLYVARHMSKLERQQIAKQNYEKEKYERFQRYAGLNLYVKNLPDNVDDEQLNTLFSPYGTIVSHKVMHGEDGKTRGFGFVCYETKEMAQRAIDGMHSKMVDNKPLVVCHAEMKEQRVSRFQSQSRRDVFRPNRPGRMGMGGPPKPGTPTGGYPYGRGGQPQHMMAPGGYPGPSPHHMMAPPPHFPASAAAAAAFGQQPPHPASHHQPGLPPHMMQGGPPGGAHHGQQARLKRHHAMPPAGPLRGMPPPQAYGPTGGYPGGLQQSHQPPLNVPPQAKTNQELITQLASLDTAQAKQLIGEKLFVEITSQYKDIKGMAGKITGMLLDMDNTELIHLLEDRDALARKVREALNVLKQHSGQTAGPAE